MYCNNNIKEKYAGNEKKGDDDELKKGGKAKKKSKFPDHSGDGKITKKDILMAKGIIPKKKKMKKGKA
jgi:hypothetical protein